MTFSIIGTGNIAWFLAQRLTAAGHGCVGIYGRDRQAAAELAHAVQTKVCEQLSDVQYEADICFIAVSDNAISSIARQLSIVGQTVLVHTGGAVDVNVLATAAKDVAVLWPIYSIAKNNLPKHRNIPCAWEASSDKAKRYLLSIAHGITDVLFEADMTQRQWLHLSAVMSNNFVTHLIAICDKICAEQQLPAEVLKPIIEQTFDRIKRENAYTVQTGPARRGDTATIAKHRALLSQHADWQQVYKAITSSIENMYNVNSQEKHL